MLHFPEQQFLRVFRPRPVGSVPRDFRRADDPAFSVPDGRHGQRNIKQTSILALANRFIVVDPLAAPDPLENCRFLAPAFRGDQDGDWLADHLFSQIAEQALRAAIPGRDVAFEILAQDRIIGGLDDGSEPLLNLLGMLLLGDIDQHVDGADQNAGSVEHRRGIGHEVDAAAVRPFRDRCHAPDRSLVLQRKRHRTMTIEGLGVAADEALPFDLICGLGRRGAVPRACQEGGRQAGGPCTSS